MSIKVVYLQRYLVVAWLVSREAAVVLAHIQRTPYNRVPVYGVTSCKATYMHMYGRVHVRLAVTCHLRFWQNDQDVLHATSVTWGGMNTEIIQHKELTLPGHEPATFCSRVKRSTTEVSLLSHCYVLMRAIIMCRTVTTE